MKLALIGNMNNNNFSIMRYFRDLGVDAYLLLYEDDGKFSHEHFRVEADTWNVEKWRPFIIRMQIGNSITAGLDFPASWLAVLPSALRRIMRSGGKSIRVVSRSYIRKILADYDCLIGSGIAPALCERAGRRLDAFVPYSTGVEYLGYPTYLQVMVNANPIKRYLMSKLRDNQISGVKKARRVFNAELGITENVLSKIGVKTLPLPMPMIYANENYADAKVGKILKLVHERIKSSKLSIIHHARIMWINKDCANDDDWKILNKNNNWLIEAFAKLAVQRAELMPLLIMVEYGQDVFETKILAKNLGVEDRIVWLPKLDRRELMWLISRVTIGCGEFYETEKTIWGGTGWEILASGKPLLQSFRFALEDFEKSFGHPPPPMLPVRSRDEVLQRLCFVADNLIEAKSIGEAAKLWFNKHNGINLAKKWLFYLQDSAESDTWQ